MKYRCTVQQLPTANGWFGSVSNGSSSGRFWLCRFGSNWKHFKAGQIFVNEWFAGGVETPFGGYGKSGYGREKGREALLNYVQTKNIAIKLGHN